MFVASLTNLLIAPLNKVALSNYAGVGLVPVFEIAFNGTMQLRSLVQVGLGALMPAVSQRGAAGTPEARRDIRRLYKRSVCFLLVIAPPGYVLAVLLAHPLLAIWLGSRFRPEIVTAFDILWASALVSLIAVPAYYVLMATGRVRHCMVSHMVAAAANIAFVGMCLALHGTLSLRGAAFAVLTATAVSSAYLMFINRIAMGAVRCQSSFVRCDGNSEQLTTDN